MSDRTGTSAIARRLGGRRASATTSASRGSTPWRASAPDDDARALVRDAPAPATPRASRAEAEPLYRRALEAGLDDDHRTQAVIQLASTLRNLGRLEESLDLLRAEYDRGPDAPLHDATAAFYALALVSRATRWPRHPSPSRRSPRTCRATPARSPPTPMSS